MMQRDASNACGKGVEAHGGSACRGLLPEGPLRGRWPMSPASVCLCTNELAPRRRCRVASKMSHFLQHQPPRKHPCAASDRTPALYLSAPGIKTFAQLLEDFRVGKANGQTAQGIGCHAKVSSMKLCLAEAIRKRPRDGLPKAMSLTLHSDASKGRVLARGQFCGEALQPTRVLLGTATVAEDFDCTALGLAPAILVSSKIWPHRARVLPSSAPRRRRWRPTPISSSTRAALSRC